MPDFFVSIADAIHAYSDEIAAIATVIITIFTIVLAQVGRAQVKDTRILQRAYVSVEPGGIEPLNSRSVSHGTEDDLLGQLAMRNAGNLPARNVRWSTRIECDSNRKRSEFPIDSKVSGNNVIPPGSVMGRGTPLIKSGNLVLPKGSNAGYCYVWGRVFYDDGFGVERTTDFCHRYNCGALTTENTIPAKYARFHEHGNDAT
jgi:hypothetical protein